MAELQPSEVLCIPKRRRLTHSRFKNEEGQEVLHLFYGEVELIFDEPDVAPVGEKLMEVEKFRAEDAMAWSNAAPHAWEKIRDLLQALLDQNVLKRVAELPASIAAETFPLKLGHAPGRTPFWVELKATGEVPTDQQLREHNRMRRLGELVYVVDSTEGVLALLLEQPAVTS